ncbi:hypothetical protein TOI97_00130 [Denitrificimonas sp. JX-1]|uniref:Iron-sulfur cluster assembly scaffold protein n=1 Tax=Denitrificimonas halotolerans TaxID=3098930 RepID=A0ABU5GNU6_9GAMM|nr:hypothetical protein [Denitrificimonas sp. JX-1]MDY7217995.1 hypothetical protein [Denitrificimonas sp. JX-1]
MHHPADTKEQIDLLALFRQYAASVRRDRRLAGDNVLTLTLQSQLASHDSVTLDAKIEAGVVSELGYRVRACSLAQASTGILAARVPGLIEVDLLRALKDLETILQNQQTDSNTLIWPELQVFVNAIGMPDRHQVVLLPFQVLQQLFKLEESKANTGCLQG